MTADGVAEVTVQEPAEERRVLDVDGLVQSKTVPDRLDLGRRGALTLGVHDLNGIAGHEMDEQRHCDRRDEDGERSHRDSSAEKAPHLVTAPPWGAGPTPSAGPATVQDCLSPIFTSLKTG